MKEIELTQGYVALVDDEDFGRVKQFPWYARLDKRRRHWYAMRNLKLPDGKRISQSMHRFVVGLEYGDPREVDHIERTQTLDNRRQNLRTTLDQNQQNIGLTKANTSGFKGVYWHTQGSKWCARIRHKGNLIHLGLFATAEEGAQRYDDFAWLLHGEFAATNTSLGLLGGTL